MGWARSELMLTLELNLAQFCIFNHTRLFASIDFCARNKVNDKQQNKMQIYTKCMNIYNSVNNYKKSVYLNKNEFYAQK